jgi:hypothetical protein
MLLYTHTQHLKGPFPPQPAQILLWTLTMVSGEVEQVESILCNDPTGLLLASRGDIEKSGVYTNLIRLASQLGVEGDPLITIDCDDATLLIKEYDGHAIAVRVPTKIDEDEVDVAGSP